ncbi:VRR-NUC domain-containing protein [Ganoderma leucocontextum]|nr:VRR-NUC domain-containing protein [Ganoderma leucocontextum]
MVLGSPSPSTVAKLVFWSEADAGPSGSGAVGGDAGTAEVDVRGQNGQSMYVTLFEDMLKEVIASEGNLFVKEELDLFMDWHRLSGNDKYLFCRLLLRKTDKWHRYTSLKYEQELGADGILAAMESLCRKRKDDVEQEHEDVKPKLEDLNTNIPDLNPPSVSVKVEEEDIKPKLEPVETALLAEAPEPPQRSKEHVPEVIDLTMDEVDEPPQAGPSRSSPAVEPPSSSAPSSQSSTRIADYTVFADDEEQADLFELLDCLTTPELDELAKQLKLKSNGVKRRDNLIDAILRGSAAQTTLPFTRSKKGKEPMVQTKLHFGIKKTEKSLHQAMLPFKPTPQSQRTQQDRVRAIVTKKLKKCIRLNPDVVALFRRVNLVYFRSTQYTEDLLTPALLARAKKREYAAYACTRTSDIWPTREDLLAYEAALEIEAKVDALLDSGGVGPNGGSGRSTASRTPAPMAEHRFKTPVTPRRATRASSAAVSESPVVVKAERKDEEETERVRNARKVKELMETVYPKWIDLVQAKGEENPRRKGLERFDCGHILTRVVSKGAAALGTLKEYEEELKVLETLLAQQRWRRGRRGRWYERRALILMTHLKDEPGRYQEAMEVVIAGLEDPDTHIVFRPMLERRLTRLEKKLKVPPGECHICEGGLKTAKDVYVEGERIRPNGIHLDTALRVVGRGPGQTQGLAWRNRRELSPKKPKEEKPEKGGKSIWKGRDDEEVNVETLALQYYEEHGCKGFHCEGRIVTTLFGLLFWDVIFAPIPGAFETSFQSAPLDIVEDTFYYSRQELIDARLEGIRDGKAAEILEQTYDANTNVMCVGVRWDLFQKEDLLGIVRCMDTDVLVAICRLMCEDYGARAAGVPDLIVWHEDEGYAKFVEVKGPGDTLQENQKVWIDVLLQAGMPVEVCHVYEEGDAPKPKKGTAVKKEKAGKKAGQKRKRDDWLVESEDEAVDYSQLDRHTEDEADETAAASSPKKRRTRANANADEPASPVGRKVARVNSQVEVVITSTPSSSRHPSSSPSKSKGSPSKSKGSPSKGKK